MAVAIIGAMYFYFVYISNSLFGYKFIDSKASLDKRHEITQFVALSESIYAPYGKILVLSGEKVSSPEMGHVIFGGWCGYGVSYEWKSADSVEIICDMSHEESIYTASEIASGIKIIVKKTLHPNDALKDAPDSKFLIGRWRCDVEKTLAELKSRENFLSSRVQAFESVNCGYFTEIEFTDTTRQIFNNIKSEEPISYVAKEKSKDEIVVNSKSVDSGSEMEYTFVKLSDDSVYIRKEDHDGFKWNQYLKRIK